MANKVRFGLKNTKYALYNAQSGTYGALKEFKGAVSLSLSREGGDSADFYADDGIYHTFAGTNGGYSMELEMARFLDEVRVDLLGEVVDSTTGIQYEITSVNPPEFALVTEMQGDENPIGFVFYSCKASRPEFNANTKNESPDVDTDTINIRVGAKDFTIDGVTQSVVQGHIEKTASNADKYTAFFSAVTIPGGGSGNSGLSA